ncbi:MAG: protein kinase [Acidobacteria bacterium]|nr:protein kinase [Acidobacteriota bacterium]
MQTHDHWQLVEDIFHAALERPPAERAAYVVEVCEVPRLREDVQALLAAHEQADDFMEQPLDDAAVDWPSTGGAISPNSFAHYRMLSLLGKGGMGEVWLAEDTQLGRKVAIKLLPAEFTTQPERVRRFTQEARAASALNHPNIITIHEIGEAATAAGSAHYIVTEYVDGETLRQRMQGVSQPIELREAINLTLQIAAALSAAHEAGITHRDIKPENVMVRRDGIVKVLDFGLAKLLRDGGGGMRDESEAGTSTIHPSALIPHPSTMPGIVMGTPRYMSPEQARGEKVDQRSDIFSLGVLLYEMVTGEAPFTGASAAEILVAILEREPPLSDLPAKLERIVSRCLAKQREQRYPSAQELLADLKDLAAQLSQSNLAQSELAQFERASPRQNWKARRSWLPFVWLSLLLAIGGFFTYWFFTPVADQPIESIAVLPFENESKNNEAEYLSDGMTESLINSLAQLPGLAVKARSTVFRYKGRPVEPQQAANELAVQAVVSGRVVQHGADLTLYLALVDGRNGNQLWGAQYDRKMTDLVALQYEITRDVSRKLQARLSGADERKLAKNYPANAEAYQLYLKGRYHVLKLTPAEIQKGIAAFQAALQHDPNYALAYVGLADAYRTQGLAQEMRPTEVFPPAKAAANQAIEIDDSLAEAHGILGYIIFWYDWDWAAAENQIKQALELDPNSADAHLYFAQLLSNTGRHAEALAQIKRARELDPLNLRINAFEAQFLIHAGRAGEAIDSLQKTSELDPNYWFIYQHAASAYIEKGMFAEAAVAARKGLENYPANSRLVSFLAYALAKSGRRAEARAELEALLKLSTRRYVPPYNLALIYHGLGERDQTLAWLERGIEQRDPRMTFLKVEPKWNNLRTDPRFQALLRRIGLPQ